MSQQERELDNSIPVVRHKATESIDADTGMSAADIIKQEWAAKNKEAEEKQRNRLDSFKFGGSSTDLQSNQAEPQESKDSSDEESKSDAAPSKPDESATTTTTPASPKTVRARKRQGLHQASLSQPLVIGVEALRDDHKRSRSVHNKALPVAPAAESEAPPLTPVSDLPTEFQAYLDVPPSPVEPTPTKKQESGRTSKAERLQHSSQPSKESNHSGRGRLSPLPVDTVTKASPTLPNKTTLVSPSSAISPTDTLVGSHHGRNNSIPRAGSGSSSLVDSASSTTQSSDSLASPGVKLVTKSVDNGFPVIMESPIEDGRHEAVSMDHVLASADVVSSSGHGHDDAKEASPMGVGSSDSLPPPPVPERDRDTKRTPIKSPKLGAVAEQVLSQQQESTTPMVQRKKTINPFKRNQQPAADGSTPAKRSLRSVVGTVLRPRRDAENNGGVQPPTSPTSPHGRAVSPPPQAPGSPTKRHQQPAVVRQAVNPVYYSGGDISAQANAIKNDEERRMAELAFMF
ncbi:hypothetical protein H1R20_g12441, partial [Candolleomyces eurysporus]